MNPMHKNLLEDIGQEQNRACIVVVQEKFTGRHVGRNAQKPKIRFFCGFNKKGALQSAWSTAGAKILTPYEAANICGIIRNKGYYCHVAHVQLTLLGGAA